MPREISHPLKMRNTGIEVVNLQDALELLINRKVLILDDLEVSEKLLRALARERARQIFGDNGTFQLVQLVQKQHNRESHGEVDEVTADLLNKLLKELGALEDPQPREFVVKGQVTLANGLPASGFIVRARDRDLRTSQPLGDDALTNDDGRYEISYARARHRRAEKNGNADLVVRVFSADSKSETDKPLVESPTLFNAPAVAEINLQIPQRDAPQSEFERHVQTILPLLEGQDENERNLTLDRLKDEDIDLLARFTSIEREQIDWLSSAFAFSLRNASTPKTNLHVEGDVPPALFYGWLREGLASTWDQLIEQSIPALRATARAAMDHGFIPAALEESLESSLNSMVNPRRDELLEAVTVVGLDAAGANTLLQNASSLAEVNDFLISTLANERKITTEGAHRIGIALTTRGLVNNNPAAISAVIGTKPARLGGRGLERARDLAALEEHEIEAALRDADVEPPAGITLKDYANELSRRIEETFPTDTFLHRVTNIPANIEGAVVRAVESRAPQEGQPPLPTDPELQAFINLHPGLDLQKVIDEATDPATAMSTMKSRLDWVQQLRELNPDIDLLAIDYLPESESIKKVKFDGLSEEARSMVIADLKAYQRIGAVGGDTLNLLRAGYTSATALARALPDEVAEKTGLPEAVAQAYQAQAQQKANEAALLWMAFHDLEREQRNYKNDLFVQPPEYLKKLNGYADLFGTLNFCQCEHCKSVLGPGAYFIDLLFFVDRHILSRSFKNTGGENNQLHLRRRRSDLWTLKINCENTTKVVPSLEIVIELLESFIVKEKQLASVAQLYQRLATVDHSVRLPFSLPLERLTIFLSHIGLTLSEIARGLLLRNQDAALRVRARLGMPLEQFRIITRSRLGDLSVPSITAAEEFFSVWLRAPFTLSTIAGQTETATLASIGVVAMMRAAGADRPTTKAILTSDFVNGSSGGAPSRILLDSGIPTPGNVQNDTELVRNLTAGRLDRFERFLRLWRHIPWSVVELDYVITRLQRRLPTTSTDINRLDAAMVIALGQLLDLQERFQLPVDELCALWDVPPRVPLRGESSLFDRVFNLPSIIKQNVDWPDANQQILGSAGNRARLMAALQITDSDLGLLAEKLNACLGRIDTDAQGNQTFAQGTWTNERNLALLYSHARIARLLGLSIRDLFQTIAWTTDIAAKPANERCVRDLSDLHSLLRTHAWRVGSGFSIEEAQFILNEGTTLAGFESASTVATQIVREVTTERPLNISIDVFTQVGLTQNESANVVDNNTRGGAPVLERIPGEESFRIIRAIAAESVPSLFMFDAAPHTDFLADVAREIYGIIKLAGDNGFEASAFEQLGLSINQAVAFVDANLSTTATDNKSLESAGGMRFRRRAIVSEASAIAGFADNPANVDASKAILKKRALDLVLRHHAETVLAAKASAITRVTPEKAKALLGLVKPDTSTERQALVDSLQGGPIQDLVRVLDKLIRYGVLLRSAVFDSAAIEFLQANKGALALSGALTVETLRRVSSYVTLATNADPAYQSNAAEVDAASLQQVLTWATSLRATDAGGQLTLTAAQFDVLAQALAIDATELKKLLPQLEMPIAGDAAARIIELGQLRTALGLFRRGGAPAEILKLAVSDDHDELTRAADGIFAAIRARYADDKTFHETLEPFEDKLRSRNRDGMVEYLLSAPDETWWRRFAGPNDLYQYFLTDVMVEGCARTSRVVAAISSVQLYVHRVLMNLEQNDQNPPTVVARFDDVRRQQEWLTWRKNYRVWEANRKVFLFPENYIEPGLRDNKTPLFEELEATLFQRQITEQRVLEAYAEYLHGFEEVARLKIAGAYHARSTDGDTLHLFGVTASEPPVYYYRTIRDLEHGGGPIFSEWRKVDLQIPVRKVSSIVYLGRLYVFWVEVSTRSLNELKNGSSVFVGYRHSVRIRFSQLRLDGRWSTPQTLRIAASAVVDSDSLIVDDALRATFQNVEAPGAPLITFLSTSPSYFLSLTELSAQRTLVNQVPTWDPLVRDQREPLEDYKPAGWEWQRVYPSIDNNGNLRLTFLPRNNGTRATSAGQIDLWQSTLSNVSGQSGNTAYAIAQEETLNPFNSPGSLVGKYQPHVDVVNGNVGSLLIEVGEQEFFVQLSNSGYVAKRLSTSMVTQVGQFLSIGGIKGLLDLQSQQTLTEASPTLSDFRLDELVDGPYKNNPYREYFREVFFHIPFLIADHLNSQQAFSDAQRWYHYLFDPTASDGANDKLRPWRYREFREVPIQDLRKAMTDVKTLDAYRRDPFNPHAIARLRPGAYQKSIVMKYIDNLLDWGDSLFAQFTMESVNEATMLYVMAADILGPRPLELGGCSEASALRKTRDTYETIAELLVEDKTDFLIEEFENFRIVPINSEQRNFIFQPSKATQAVMQANALTAVGIPGASDFEGTANPAGWNNVGAPVWKEKDGTALTKLYDGGPIGGSPITKVGGGAVPTLRLSGDPVRPPDNGGFGVVPPVNNFGTLGTPEGFDRDTYVPNVKHTTRDIPLKPLPPDDLPPQINPFELAHSRLVFCFPENKELRGYWDRVEDRLNKIRNCMDIAGVHRRLELFAPEIDPRLLVRMRALGLTLDDVMNVTSGNLPPYRFTYLIEKAKQYASLVQNFGNQLLGALERRDTEELTRLRTVHEQNLLKLRSRMMNFEINAAQDTLESLNRQKVAIEYRRDHFQSLLEGNLNGSERIQLTEQVLATGFTEFSSLFSLAAGIAHLIPQLGAPTAMKYGGKEVGDALQNVAGIFSALSARSDSRSRSAGVVASFARRTEDWKHQVELAKRELAQIEKQITAAQIRREIAVESQMVHERSVEQVQEIFDFLRDRFTNFGRFTWLSAELQKLHRLAFNSALSMARLAEQACHFERADEAVKPELNGNYWDPGNSGLLAGDRLLIDLYNLERQYIETNQIRPELEQSFSLMQFDPSALVKLRKTGKCTFKVPELFFDLVYAGQFRRRIKGVRLTIPCVVGPYANVGAKLRLLRSWLRKDAKVGDTATVELPLRDVTSVSTSTAQNDSGVFEFNFRDERYMPFEGAGAISEWELSLPKVPSFDYQTISDVILRISYTSTEDNALRELVENQTGTVIQYLQASGMTSVFSLRHDFPNAWSKLVRAPLSTDVDVVLTPRHLPFFMSEMNLQSSVVDVLLLVKEGISVTTNPTIVFDNQELGDASFGVDTGTELRKASSTAVTVIGKHTLKITSAGSFAPSATSPVPTATLDESQLTDVLLRVSLKKSVPSAPDPPRFE